MRTTVHVQRDPSEHYDVVLKHRSGQPKTIHHLRIKHGNVRSEESVFFGRNALDEDEQGILLGFIGADHEDLRMAIDCLTELRNHLRYKAASPKELLTQCIHDDKVREWGEQFEALKHVEPAKELDEHLGKDPAGEMFSAMLEAAGAKVVDVTPKKRAKKNSRKRILPGKRLSGKRLTRFTKKTVKKGRAILSRLQDA